MYTYKDKYFNIIIMTLFLYKNFSHFGVDAMPSVFIGIFKSLKYDVKQPPYIRGIGIGPLVGRITLNRSSIMHIKA